MSVLGKKLDHVCDQRSVQDNFWTAIDALSNWKVDEHSCLKLHVKIHIEGTHFPIVHLSVCEES